MASKIIRLYEDNGGGLHMTDGVTVVSGLEYNELGSIVNDITTFGDWQDSATHRTPYSEMQELFDYPSTELVATYDGSDVVINVRATGLAGRRYAGLTVEPDTW